MTRDEKIAAIRDLLDELEVGQYARSAADIEMLFHSAVWEIALLQRPVFGPLTWDEFVTRVMAFDWATWDRDRRPPVLADDPWSVLTVAYRIVLVHARDVGEDGFAEVKAGVEHWLGDTGCGWDFWREFIDVQPGRPRPWEDDCPGYLQPMATPASGSAQSPGWRWVSDPKRK